MNNAEKQTYGPYLSMDQAAKMLAVPRTRIKQLERENHLFALKVDGKWKVPARLLEPLTEEEKEALMATADFAVEGDDVAEAPTHKPLEHLRGTLTVLRDGGWDNDEIAQWLWEHNDELEQSPIEALEHRLHHHVNTIATVEAL